MKKLIPVLIVLVFLLSACDILGGTATDTPMSDAQMATRVAQLLSTMTTPTTEIVFPPTPTMTSTVVILPTEETVEPTATMTEEVIELETTTPATKTTAEATGTNATETVGGETEGTATVTPTVSSNDPASQLGTPTGTDEMTSASTWGWPTDEDQYLKVSFNNGKMLMTGLTKFAGWRLPLIGQQTNTYIELTANSGDCSGKDSYGIIFRVPVLKDPSQGYLFEVTCDGYYRLWKWDGKVSPNGLATVLVPWAQTSLINAGANQTNKLGVMVKDDKFTLYMNGEKLASATDSAFDAGFFGVFVRAGETSEYTVKFEQMRYWENP
jgi:hypothetical protein